MRDNPIREKTNEPVSTSLEYTLARLREVFRIPRNEDAHIRRMTVSEFGVALVYFDSLIDAMHVNLHVLEPMLRAPAFPGEAAERIQWLHSSVLTAVGVSLTGELDEAVDAVLQGSAALFVEGCGLAILVDAKGFPRRGVEQPVNEKVVVGPHEAFVESLKSNIALVRRVIKSQRLVAEAFRLGTGVKTNCALLYLDGVAGEQMLTELRRRLENINMDHVMSSGELEQLIEDAPFALLPQFTHTERPDRTASFLLSGMAVLMVEGSPIALSAPASLMTMLHTSELTALRFPYAAFKRIVVTAGLLVTLVLPAFYLAVVTHHNEALPLALLTSLYESESRIPVPHIYEFIMLILGFDLVNEAGARMPGVLSQGLGVVSALILGQAAVAADLISPLMLIVVALAALGSLIMPEYGLSVALRIAQLALAAIAAAGGLFGILLALVVAGVELCQITSLGVPLMWQTAPERMHNPDVVARYPLWQQRVRFYLSNPGQMLRANGRVRAWERRDGRGGH